MRANSKAMIDADKQRLVETKWTKSQLIVEHRKATKALKEAREIERVKLESGEWHYVEGPLRSQVLVKKPRKP